ncbi:MAG: class I SAM-dependent methyltransferase [Candidatus Sericytochromatia bacterium]
MAHSHIPQPGQDPKDFWEQRYAESVSRTRGKAGKFLQQYVAPLPAQRVLELGCSTGDDSLWLAEQGWRVTALDISEHAVQTAQRLAQEAGLAERIAFQACDLALHLPEGEFELVCALYFQSPFDFPRASILQRAAQCLVPGGHLLVVSHASGPPWGPQPGHEHVFPTLESELRDLGLHESDWQIEAQLQTRRVKGPEGQEADVADNLIFARRRS